MADERNLRETLDLLDVLESDASLSQKSLSERIGVAVGLVNMIVRRAVRKGFIKVSQAPVRRYAYYLTPKGLAEKSRLVSEYLQVSLDFYRYARADYCRTLERARAMGHKRVALVGAGELAEIAMLSAGDLGISLKAVVDVESIRTSIQGIPVVRSVDDLDVDVYLLTDGRDPQAAYDRLVAQVGAEKVLAPALLRIARERAKSED